MPNNNVAMNTAPAAKKIKKPNFFTKRRDYNIWGYFVLILGAAVMVFPFLFAVSGSLVENPMDVYKFQFFKDFHWQNYVRVLTEVNLLRYIGNTLVIIAHYMVGFILSNSFIGFGFAIYRFKGSEALFFIILATMFVPSTVMQVPTFLIFSELGVIDTYVPLIFGSFFGAPMRLFLMRQCFKGLPGGLYEAALIDGANPLYIYARIYMPLARPMLATLALQAFQGGWNELFGPLIYITSQEKRTLSLALANLNTSLGAKGDAQLLLAAAVIAMTPSIIVYALVQKQFIAGMASAAIKG